MIPRGRQVATAAQVAELAGVPLRTWRRRDAPAFERAVPSLFQGRYLIYDLEQTQAFLDEQPVPPLPSGEHPSDLVNDKEAAAILSVEPSTIRAYRQHEYLPPGQHPQGADGLPLTSIRVTARRALEDRRASLPDSHVPRRAGRPAGSKLQADVERLVEHRREVTAKDVAETLGISPRHARRLIQNTSPTTITDERAQRLARTRELLANAPLLSLSEIAATLGVSKTQAHRLVHAAREATSNPNGAGG